MHNWHIIILKVQDPYIIHIYVYTHVHCIIVYVLYVYYNIQLLLLIIINFAYKNADRCLIII